MRDDRVFQIILVRSTHHAYIPSLLVIKAHLLFIVIELGFEGEFYRFGINLLRQPIFQIPLHLFFVTVAKLNAFLAENFAVAIYRSMARKLLLKLLKSFLLDLFPRTVVLGL